MNDDRQHDEPDFDPDATSASDPFSEGETALTEASGGDTDPTASRPSARQVRQTDAAARELEPSEAVIGPYRLVKKIGEGGMGEVWIAEQREPLRRTVALKVVKRGLDTAEFVARFESERQALALMDHPGIAHVLDAGTTARGRPYFVMEYVEGQPIKRHCDDRRLPLRERLELFIRVCQGVQHAHQKAIIHRDLKPSNVLVTERDGVASPKIIDFGVAKALGQELTDQTMLTSIGQVIGTLDYMSPEQATLTDAQVDTRTDVYALGVLLYELLVGKRPFESRSMKQAGLVEILRHIREVDPPRPSERLRELGDGAKEIAARRGTSPGNLIRDVRGDLDWIVMRALEKDRARRYATANAFAFDIERHLRYEPVDAGPPSKTYRVRKFVRRHRIWVVSGAIALAAVLIGIAGTSIGLVRARRAERQARIEAETAQQVSGFLEDLFEVSDPDRARGQTITAREILDAGAQRVREDLADQEATQARLMHTIGKVYRKLGLFEEAGSQLEAALHLRRRLAAKGQVAASELADNELDLANLYIDLARYDEAAELLQAALATLGELGEGHRLQIGESLNRLASVYRRQGLYDRAEPLYKRSLAIRMATLGPEDPEVARSYNSLAILNWNRGNYSAADSLYRRALAIRERTLGEDHPDVAQTLNNLALLYHHLERYDEAEPLYERAAAIWEKTLGPEHPRLALVLNNLGLVHLDQGEFDAAEPLFERALAIREKVLGPEHPDVAQTLNNLGNLHRDRGDLAGAEPLYQRALAIRQTALGADHPDVAWSLRDLGKLYAAQGRYEESITALRRSIEILENALGPDHHDLADVLDDYAAVLRSAGHDAEAAAAAQRAAAIRDTADSDTTGRNP
jgi:non-specific serine/threonine protein kinase/serine/threonine-protein kinase